MAWINVFIPWIIRSASKYLSFLDKSFSHCLIAVQHNYFSEDRKIQNKFYRILLFMFNYIDLFHSPLMFIKGFLKVMQNLGKYGEILMILSE